MIVPADRPTIFICENLLYYLPAPTVTTLLSSLVTYFQPAGPHQQLLFDTCGTLLKKYRAANLKNTTLKTQWTIDDAHDVETFHPALTLSGRVRWEEFYLIGRQDDASENGDENGDAAAAAAKAAPPLCYGRPPLFGPWTQAVAALRHNRLFKEAMQVVRYDFGRKASAAAQQTVARGSGVEAAGATTAASPVRGPSDERKMMNEAEMLNRAFTRLATSGLMQSDRDS